MKATNYCKLFVVCISLKRRLQAIIFTGFVFAFFLGYQEVAAQEYGLGFIGKETSKDRRTQLDLNPDKFFKLTGEFEISFDIRIRDDYTSFGYVFRIVDQENDIVDLLFNGPGQNSYQLVISRTLSNITIPNADSTIFKEWSSISARFDIKNQVLTFSTPDTVLTLKEIPLNGNAKIYFGRTTHSEVKTTDVPAMDVKDIRIRQRGGLTHHFPLDELEGDVAKDILSNRAASVKNPNWLRPAFYDWGDEYVTTRLKGFAPVCFAASKDIIYLVGEEQLKEISLRSDSIKNYFYPNPFLDLTTASQLVFDSLNNNLICYNHRTRTIHYFDFAKSIWVSESDGPNNPDRLWFHNKYYSPEDSLLYLFGGYSQYKYHNEVFRYDFRSNEWDTVPASGDTFHPRMHAALGSKGDTIYILGGFGSKMGDQLLGPHHYTDLVSYHLKDRKFTNIYEFRSETKDVDFGHSLVFDENGEDFYVLSSSIYEYDSYLQLLKGNLNDPELVAMGSRIHYFFHNENSYADLFFSSQLKQFIAITTLADIERNETKVSIYTLSYPPIPSVSRASNISRLLSNNLLWIIIILAAVVSTLVIIRLIRRINNPIKATSKVQSEAPERSSQVRSALNRSANSVVFFGGFQIINRNGEDITGKFTPLLKELFLLIFLNSIKDKGISVPGMTEQLWFSMDSKSAKNNRAVNIAKLKHLLSELDCCVLTRKTEYWRIIFEEGNIYSDYITFQNLTNQENELTKEELKLLLSIVGKGPLLGNASYEWLDEFKLDCSNRITDVLVKSLESKLVSEDKELTIRTTDAILIFDMMHEEAIMKKCQALYDLGKHSLGKEIFDKFRRDYHTLYNEPYNKAFVDIVKH